MESLKSLIEAHIQVFGYAPSIWDYIPNTDTSYAEFIYKLGISDNEFYKFIN